MRLNLRVCIICICVDINELELEETVGIKSYRTWYGENYAQRMNIKANFYKIQCRYII